MGLPDRGRRTDSGCLVWMGDRNSKGYGRIRIGGRRRMVHRVVWEEEHGPIPAGRMVCHHCDNPPCFEDEHLFLGSGLDNYEDSLRKGRAAKPRKLTDRDVVLLRMLYESGEFSLAFLADGFGIAESTAHVIGAGYVR